MGKSRTWLQGRAAPRPLSSSGASARLAATERPPLIYAIGDVHGCLDRLCELEALIGADAEGTEGEKWLVLLGDYVDRGPDSADVIAHLLAPPTAGFRRLCLRGNHETILVQALADPAAIGHWLALGGDATLRSYGLPAARIDALRRGERGGTALELLDAVIPQAHLDFIRRLPALLCVPGFIFVHAGLRPGVVLADQDEDDMVWIREQFLDADYDFGARVVHGHTPAAEPFASARRIGIDTGCFMTGRLTAVRIDAAGTTRFLQAGTARRR